MLMLAYGASVGGLLTPVGSPAEPDRPRPHRGGHRREDLVRRLDDHGAPDLRADVRRAGGRPAAAQQAGDPQARRASRSTSTRERARAGRALAWPSATRSSRSPSPSRCGSCPASSALIAGTDSERLRRPSATGSTRASSPSSAPRCCSCCPPTGRSASSRCAWSDAAKIDWGTIVLFGTGIIFGSLLADTGLAETIGNGASDTLGLGSAFAITIFAVVLAILVSETTSNTASAAVVVPIIIPIAMAAGVDPFVPALAATFAASFGFMLPVSTPQNAIVYGSGTRADHQDDPLRLLLRRARRDPDPRCCCPLMVAVVGLADAVTHSGSRVIPGDGIGPEVIGATRTVLDAVGRRARPRPGLRRVRLVVPALRRDRRDDARRRARHARARTTRSCSARSAGPGVPDHVSLWGLLIPIRRALPAVRQPAADGGLRGRRRARCAAPGPARSTWSSCARTSRASTARSAAG